MRFSTTGRRKLRCTEFLTMIEWISALLTALKMLQPVFREGDIPVCQTRVMRQGRGLPWGQQILVHPREDGMDIVQAVAPKDSTKGRRP